MAQLYNRDIRSRMHIRFVNQYGQEEMGMDAGGLTKEFLTRIFKYSSFYAEWPSTLLAAASSKMLVSSSSPTLIIGVSRKASSPANTSSSVASLENPSTRT